MITTFTIVGMRHQPKSAQDRVVQINSGDTLLLKPEPDNKVSVDAVAVMCKANSTVYEKIGYLKEEHAKQYLRDYGRAAIKEVSVTVKREYYIGADLKNQYTTSPAEYIPDWPSRVEANRNKIDNPDMKKNIKNPCGEIFLQDYKVDLNSPFNKTQEKTLMNKIVDTNVSLANQAAVLEAGRIANNQAVRLVSSKAPLMLKGYVDTPFGKIVLANLAQMAAQKMRPTDKRLAGLTNAMGLMAYQELVQVFDVEGMINDMLDSDTIKSALSAFDNE